jgi:hypothetical protein
VNNAGGAVVVSSRPPLYVLNLFCKRHDDDAVVRVGPGIAPRPGVEDGQGQGVNAPMEKAADRQADQRFALSFRNSRFLPMTGDRVEAISLEGGILLIKSFFATLPRNDNSKRSAIS